MRFLPSTALETISFAWAQLGQSQHRQESNMKISAETAWFKWYSAGGPKWSIYCICRFGKVIKYHHFGRHTWSWHGVYILIWVVMPKSFNEYRRCYVCSGKGPTRSPVNSKNVWYATHKYASCVHTIYMYIVHTTTSCIIHICWA